MEEHRKYTAVDGDLLAGTQPWVAALGSFPHLLLSFQVTYLREGNQWKGNTCICTKSFLPYHHHRMQT